MSCLIINLIVYAILLSEVRVWTFGLAFVFAAYTVLQLFDKRKGEWAWWGIVFGLFLAITIPVCYIILFDLYLYFFVIGLQIIFSSVICCIWGKR